MATLRFLTVQEVIQINADQIKRFGGLHALRDYNLLDSAVHAPQASFDNTYLYSDIFEVAAVYAHSIIKNHPFVDGNKRTGVLCMLVFLHYNKQISTLTQEQLYTLGILIATTEINVQEIARLLRLSCFS